MNKIVTLFAGIIFSMGLSFGQSVAPNWTLSDCNSVNHTLHNYLDSQEVVVMEFVMGCSSCTDAGNLLMNLRDYCNVAYPGKVNFFLMDYYPSNDCVDVTTTWATHNFDASFSGCWAEKDYYYPTIFPMPAIVIAAGNYHTVIYDDLSWQNSDTTLIKQAIDQFFVTVGTEEQDNTYKELESVLMYPNPVHETVYANLSLLDLDGLKIQVYDLSGKKVPNFVSRIDKGLLVLTVANFLNGTYILELTTPKTTVRKMFVKN